jgi:hypothetical protein
MSQYQVNDADYAAAIDHGYVRAQTEIHARAIRYLPDRYAIEIETTLRGGFVILGAWIGVL